MPNRLERHVPGGAYTIQRPLPDEGRELQYRVKNVQDGHERVVSIDAIHWNDRAIYLP